MSTAVLRVLARADSSGVVFAFDPNQPRAPDGKWTSTTGGEVIAYHGTTEAVLKKIKKEGLTLKGHPRTFKEDRSQRGPSGSLKLYEDARGRAVFVANRWQTAAWYARQRKGTPVVLEIHVPKKEFKNFYRDSLHHGKGAAVTFKKIPPSWIKKASRYDNWVGLEPLKFASDDDERPEIFYAVILADEVEDFVLARADASGAVYAAWDESKHRTYTVALEGGEWVVRTADGSRVLGRHKTEQAARDQLQAIEAAKHSRKLTQESDYAEVATRLDALEAAGIASLREVLLEIKAKLEAQVRGAKDAAGLRALASRLKPARRSALRDAVLELMRRAWDAGSADAREEITTTRKHATVKPKSSFIPRPALQWLRQKAFYISDVLGDRVLADAKGVILNAIKTGRTTQDALIDLAVVLLPYLGDPAVVQDDEQLTPHRLETIVRTNTTEAYNHGRLTTFVDPEVLPFVDWIRYSAILDTRTTEVCRFLHMKLFKPGSSALEELLPPNHFNCFISPRTKVFTAKGWLDIGRIALGDLVLTHKGRFRPVTFVHHKQAPRIYSGEVVEVNLAPSAGLHKRLVCTPEHPVLTDRGWIAANTLTTSDRVLLLAKLCVHCGKLIARVAGNGEDAKYCSARCQMNNDYKTGVRDGAAITCAAHQQIRLLGKTGKYRLSAEGSKQRTAGRVASAKWRRSVTELRRGDLNPIRVHAEAGRRNGLRLVARWRKDPRLHGNYSMKNVSAPQRKIFEVAQTLWPTAALEHPLKVAPNRFRFLDIALPEHKVAIEYDGLHWHQDTTSDCVREEEISRAGWQVLRYRDRVPSRVELQHDVASLLANHRGEYKFTPCAIKSVRVKTLKRCVKLYNISVRDDESYVVGCGAVVHNCRSIVVPVVVGETVDMKDVVTPAQIGKAKSLADAKFLTERGAWRNYVAEEPEQ